MTLSGFEADRMKAIPFSGIRKVFEQVEQMKAQGRAIIPFYIGRPDFDTPDHIKAAAKQALDEGLTTYTSNYGMPPLRRAIARKLATENGMTIDPDRQIIVTVGANEAVLMIMLGLLNAGDEVLIPDPMWLHYFHCASLAGARVVSVPLVDSNGFLPDPDDIRRLITPRTKMLVLNSPHNPTGLVYDEALLRQLAAIVEAHNLLLLSDEIYEKIIFDGARHVSPATFENITARTITVNGFAKAYAMTGWRLGYVVAPPPIIDVLVRVHQYTTVCATSFAQAGAVAALEGPQDSIAMMVNAFAERRQVILEAFQEMPGATLVRPNGAFYAFPDVRRLGANSLEVAQHLLEATGVAVVPGADFGVYGEGHLRISYACSVTDVRKGMAALREFWGRA